MSVTFHARGADGRLIFLDLDDPAHLNMASGNARLFLEFLQIEPGPEPSGEIGLPEARRAIMRARATFGRRAPAFSREPYDRKRSGEARFVSPGIDASYLAMRLDALEIFLGRVVARGAVSLLWG